MSPERRDAMLRRVISDELERRKALRNGKQKRTDS